MLLYYLFWMFMGFIKHFYITFGTNLLTQAQCQFLFFPLFQCFEEKEYQTESKWNETFWRSYIWKESNEGGTRQGGAPTPWARPPPSWAPRGSPDVHLSHIYTNIP